MYKTSQKPIKKGSTFTWKKTANEYPSAMTDIAITENELKISEDMNGSRYKIAIPVHNIGIIDAVDIDVELRSIEENDSILLEKKIIDKLEAPLDLLPRIVELEFNLDNVQDLSGNFEISLNPERKFSEITFVNNKIAFNLPE